MGRIPLTGLLCLAALAATGAKAASFDCAKASSTVEKTICADANVSRLDGALGTAYRALMKTVGDDDEMSTLVKASQRDWIKLRDTCRDAACLADTYEARIAQLDGTSSLESGDYGMGDLELLVRDLGSKGRIVMLSGGNIRWVCAYSGVATPPDGKSAVVGDAKLEVSFSPGVATIDDTPANRAVQQDYCGMNAMMLGDYDKE